MLNRNQSTKHFSTRFQWLIHFFKWLTCNSDHIMFFQAKMALAYLCPHYDYVACPTIMAQYTYKIDYS